jgi:aminopeptidase YwaD
MLINWPDKYYHTSADTLEKVDPDALARAGRLTGAYALLAATAGPEEARGLAGEMAAAFPGELHAVVAERAADPAEAERICAFFAEREQADLRSLRALAPELDVEPCCADVAAAAAAEARRAASAGGAHVAPSDGGRWGEEAAHLVASRLVPGPASLRSVLAAVTPAEREAWRAFAGGRRGGALLYELWMDGRRTLAEVCTAVRLESGSADPEYAVRYARLLAAAGVVALQEV